MAFSRRVFDEVGEFDPDFGAGTRFASCESSEFTYRCYRKGLKLAYCPDVLVYHNNGRRTDSQVRSLNKGYGIGRGAFYCKHFIKADREILKLIYWETRSLVKSIIQNCSGGKPIERQKSILLSLLIGATYKLTTFGALKWR